jgi:hypothetical protein
MDSQSVKTTEKGGGYDGGKKVKGRKRHINCRYARLVRVLAHPTYWADCEGD